MNTLKFFAGIAIGVLLFTVMVSCFKKSEAPAAELPHKPLPTMTTYLVDGVRIRVFELKDGTRCALGPDGKSLDCDWQAERVMVPVPFPTHCSNDPARVE